MAIHIAHLTKRMGNQVVLNDVSLDIPDGQIVGLLGPNGAGKSTLMKILVGLYHADEGEVNVPSSIGYLPELNPLYDDMYVREYLAFMARMKGLKMDIEPWIAHLGLTPEANKRLRSLSKGYRQRVGLAQALMGNPPLLILDEPTTGLDPNQLLEIRRVIQSIAHAQNSIGGVRPTILFSTHILQEVKEICDRVVVLDHGQVRMDKMIEETDDLEQLFIDGTKL